MPKIGPEKALEKVNGYLGEIDRLKKLGYIDGEPQREDLNHKIKAFINNAFDNPEVKIKGYDNYVNFYVVVAGEKKTTQQKNKEYQQNLREMKTMLESYGEELEMVKWNNITPEKISYDSTHIFIVHGHDSEPKWELVRMVEKEFKLEAIILDEQADMGRTIIEKFEDAAELPGYAFVLLTPDDIGGENRQGKDLGDISTSNFQLRDLDINFKPRARQNVILELGYFFAKLGRKRVCCLYKSGVEIPSDISGVIYKEFIKSVKEKEGEIRRELRAVGYDV